MGLFDSVNLFCPHCAAPIELQSKAGACNLENHWHLSVPAEIAQDLDGEPVTCRECKCSWVAFDPFARALHQIHLVPVKEN